MPEEALQFFRTGIAGSPRTSRYVRYRCRAGRTVSAKNRSTSCDLAVDWLVAELAPWADKPFAMFGHSLGAMLSLELARRISSGRQLTHLFVSGRRAPHLPLDEPPTYQLPDDEFAIGAASGGYARGSVEGTGASVAFSARCCACDFCLSQTYVYRDAPPLDVPITAFGGTEDTEGLAGPDRGLARAHPNCLPAGHVTRRTLFSST